MHHVLQIQEILLNIFGHCRLYSWPGDASDLPALARTCRAFKDPALDLLWEKVVDSSSLARCLPEASHKWIDKVSWFDVIVLLRLMVDIFLPVSHEALFV